MVKAHVPRDTQTRGAYQDFSIVIQVVQNRHAGGRTGTRQAKEITILDDTSYLFVLSQRVLQHGGFVPRELPAANCKEPFLRFFG